MKEGKIKKLKPCRNLMRKLHTKFRQAGNRYGSAILPNTILARCWMRAQYYW